MAGNRFQRGRLRDSFCRIGPLSGDVPFGHFDLKLAVHGGMKRVETIDECDNGAMDPQQGCERKKPQRFVPEIICRKIINPGIDEENVTTHVLKISHPHLRYNISNKLLAINDPCCAVRRILNKICPP
jgi:hypothetical protein